MLGYDSLLKSLIEAIQCTKKIDITPDDGNNISNLPAHGVIIKTKTAGDVKVSYLNGGEETLTLEAEEYIKHRVKKVHATGTTATVVGYY